MKLARIKLVKCHPNQPGHYAATFRKPFATTEDIRLIFSVRMKHRHVPMNGKRKIGGSQ